VRSYLRAALCALLLLLGTAVPAQAITVVNLGDFVPNALNNHRQIVGASIDPADDDAPSHAVVWSAGVLTRLGEPATTNVSAAYAINASGRIVGGAEASSPLGDHALYWDGPTDTPHQIGPLAPSGEGDFSAATGVDSAGEVVGFSLAADYSQFGFLRTAAGAITRVGDADRDGGSTSVAGITPDGTHLLGHVGTAEHGGAATGWYLWPSAGGSGTKLDLTPFPSGSQLLGSAITPQYGNALAADGTVLGYKGTTASPAYYLRLPDGSETPVNGLIGHNAVNAKHNVVGTVLGTYMGQQIPHAAVWKPDGTVVDLNSLLPASSDYILEDAMAINDNGDIVGIGGQISTQKQIGFLIPAGYVVDSTGDQPDATPGDGACLTAQRTCTLRAALQEVSAGKVASPTSVAFALPGGSGTITPASPLPAVAYPIAIDGDGKVVLNGAAAGSGASGLVLQGAASTVRGLEIDGFQGAGVRVQASDVAVGALPDDSPACAFPCNTFKSNSGAAVAVASGRGSTVTGNRLVGNARPAIDLGANGRTPNDKGDADTGANGLRDFPIGVLGAQDPVSGIRTVSGVSAAADAGALVDVYAQSTVNAARGAEPAAYVGQAQVTETGAWELDVSEGLPAADAFFSATVTTPGDGTSELSPLCGDPDGDGNPDSDGDGLCDDWEAKGIDADDDGTIDLALPGASPAHKDLYLEVDAMADGAGHSAPSQGAIDDVVAAFADAPVANPAGGTGIALHVNPGGSAVGDTVPETWINVGGTGPGTLDTIKNGSLANPCDGSFGSHDDRAAPDCFQRLAARGLAYRWVLFSYGYQEERGSSGFAAGLGGQALTVSLGQWDDGNLIWGGGGTARCRTIDACRRVVFAGTLMHELGHSLGLHHGGRDNDQFKPNYLSVMNYLFQMRGRVNDRPLDYSRFALPPLNESALVESAGIAARADALTRSRVGALWPHTGFYRAGAGAGTCDLHTAASTGAIDWDGTVPVLAESLLIHDKTCASQAKGTLTSTEDWPDLRYSFRDQEGVLSAPVFAGDASTSRSVPEETNAELMAEAARTDADGNGVNDLADACRLAPGADFADADADGFADVCEPDLTAEQAFPHQANGSGSGSGGGPGGAGRGVGPASVPAPAKDTTAPRLSRLAARPATVVRATRRRKAENAKLSFTLSEAATVTVTGEQVRKGRMSGRRCVAGRRTGKACITYKKVAGALRVSAKAGANSLTFAAKLGTRRLGAGTFRLTIVAFDAAGNRSKAATVTVRVR
jgi:CSLREA domain-containing protein